MNDKVERARGPLVVFGVSVMCLIGAFLHGVLVPVDVDVGWAFRGFIVLISVPYVVLGAAIVSRSPENRVGTLLQAIGLLFSVAGVLEEYALRGLVYDPGSLPGAIYAAWVIQWAWIVMFGLSMFVFLQFPNGRFLSRAWRRFSVFAGASIAVAAVGVAFAKGVLDSFTERPAFQNPLAIEGWAKESAETLLSVWLISLVASALSCFSRFRKSEGVERQQLKWLALGGIFTAVSFLFAGLAEGVAGFTTSISAVIGQGLVTFGIVLLPVTIGVSILRYRLYDIDVLINRALVYGSLTVALAGAYVGLVFALQALLAPFTAESDLAIAASTLGVAALFRPIRSRFQGFIDKRFYRSKFDAERTVADFSTRLRDEVELNTVSSQLVEIVRDTMQPSHLSLWLRSESPR